MRAAGFAAAAAIILFIFLIRWWSRVFWDAADIDTAFISAAFKNGAPLAELRWLLLASALASRRHLVVDVLSTAISYVVYVSSAGLALAAPYTPRESRQCANYQTKYTHFWCYRVATSLFHLYNAPEYAIFSIATIIIL